MTSRPVGLLGLWILALSVTPARAATPPGDPRPMVLIVLDSSGSMAFAGPTTETPLCAAGDSRSASVVYGRSRDIAVKEVLTGTFVDYWCRTEERPQARFDKGYAVPWYTPQFSSQADDGVLDVFGDRVKFGLVTLDTLASTDAGPGGEWSYGPSTTQQGTPVNFGVKSAAATYGGLTLPAPGDDLATLVKGNQTVQARLLTTVPFGGSPVGPALDDALRALNEASSEDIYGTCRARRVLLITDGRSEPGDASTAPAPKAAQALYAAGVPVDVVAYRPSSDVVASLDLVAKAGGTGKARVAMSPSELAAALTTVLGRAMAGLVTAAEPVATTQTGSDVDLQYQLDTGFLPSASSAVDIAGSADVTTFRCGECAVKASGDAGVCERSDLAGMLNANDHRRLWFTRDGGLREFVASEPALTADVLGIPTSGPLADLAPVVEDGRRTLSGKLLGDASSPAVREAHRRQLVALLRADPGSRRELQRLGGTWHGTPVLQTNLSTIDVPIPSFRGYKASIALRPTIAYLVTHEGFVHAFHLSRPGAGSPQGTKWLDELWAIAPQTATARMGRLATRSEFLLDGRSVLKDIRLARSKPSASAAEEAALWRSVLVVPFRKSRGLFAIDVTDPFHPFVRWEIGPGRHCWRTDAGSTECIESEYVKKGACKSNDQNGDGNGNNGKVTNGVDKNGDGNGNNGKNCHRSKTAPPGSEAGPEHDYAGLGFIQARPRIGTVFLRNSASDKNEEVAVVLVPCGTAAEGEPESGKCVMVLRLDNGFKVKEFKNGDGSVVDASAATGNIPDTLDFDVVGDPAVDNTFIGTFVSRAFVGDAGGQLWRIDTSSTDPDDWKMTFFFDVYDDLAKAPLSSPMRSPIAAEPAMSPTTNPHEVALIVAAGSREAFVAGTTQAVVESVLARTTIGASSGKVTGIESLVQWRRPLGPLEAITGGPAGFGRTAYFTTFRPNAPNACDGSAGRIYGLHYIQAGSDRSPVAALDADGLGSTTDDIVEYVDLPEQLASGLTLLQRPACSGSGGVAAAVAAKHAGSASSLRGAQQGRFVLTTHVTGKNATADSPEDVDAPTVPTREQVLKRPTAQAYSTGRTRATDL